MDDSEKTTLLTFLRVKNGGLRYASNSRRVPRETYGRVRVLGKLYKARELIDLVKSAKPPGDGRVSESLVMARANPGMIVSKVEAVALGFTMFRTGDECKYGHAGWRYVAGGACVSCKVKGPNSYGWK